MSQHWNIMQIHALSRASVNAGDTFHARRTLQRLERGEITIAEATDRIAHGRIGRTFDGGQGSSATSTQARS
jgi:hypothetical protein